MSYSRVKRKGLQIVGQHWDILPPGGGLIRQIVDSWLALATPCNHSAFFG